MSNNLTKINKNSIGFIAFPQQQHLLIEELKNRFFLDENLILKSQILPDLFLFFFDDFKENINPFSEKTPYWSRCTLFEPFYLKFSSIGEAANTLKNIQRNWASHTTTSFRRSSLIQEKLPYINFKPKAFPVKIPSDTVGVFSLIDNNTLLASAKTNSHFPCGKIDFIEDHENPPSRAYLKFQEAITNAQLYFGKSPTTGNRCFDAGACPGGWTWVLTQLNCSVFAVDRTELDSRLMNHPNVTFQKHDAFTLEPQTLGAFDWVCSDVICYPERLLTWIHKWLDSGLCKNMICTIKMQGQIDWNLISQFESIPNSIIRHMNYNKHELTWIHCSD